MNDDLIVLVKYKSKFNGIEYTAIGVVVIKNGLNKIDEVTPENIRELISLKDFEIIDIERVSWIKETKVKIENEIFLMQ